MRRGLLPGPAVIHGFISYNAGLMTGPDISEQPAICVAVQNGPVSVIELDFPGPCGAECVFLGRTRDDRHPEHGTLVRLEYEVYEPMAQKVLEKMAREAAGKFDCRYVRIVHAKGPVEPGEASVVIQVATPHRGASFDACRYLIDTLKQELPVWKKEVWRDGETFVEGCCVEHTPRSEKAQDVSESTPNG